MCFISQTLIWKWINKLYKQKAYKKKKRKEKILCIELTNIEKIIQLEGENINLPCVIGDSVETACASGKYASSVSVFKRIY